MSMTPPESAPPGRALVATAERLGEAIAGGHGDLSPAGQRRAVLRLLSGVAVLVGVAAALHWLTVLGVILAIVVFVMLHELGHMLTAKWSGMKVTEYFVGFGPRLWSVRRGETEYGVKALPAGGYVRIIGMSNLDEVPAADEARSFRQQSFPKRVLVVSAGSITHFLIALTLLWTINAFVGVPVDKGPVRIQETLGLTTGQSPAQAAGLRAGDVIVGAAGQPVTNFVTLKAVIESHTGQDLTLDVRRGSALLHLVAHPVDINAVTVKPVAGVPATTPTTTPAHAGAPAPSGFLGVVPGWATETANPVVAVGRAGQDFGRAVGATFAGLAHLVSPSGLSHYAGQIVANPSKNAGPAAGDRPSSVIGIVRLSSQAAKQGALPFLTLLAFINVFFGVFNLLPVWPFDGGYIAVAVYERLRSRRGRPYHADMARMMPVAYVMMLVLGFLFITTMYLDVVQPINLPK